MRDLFKKAKEHPAVSLPLAGAAALLSIYLTAAAIWSSIYIDRPFLPTLWNGLMGMAVPVSLATVWVVVPLIILGLSVSVIVAVGVSAVQKGREIAHLKVRLAQSDDAYKALDTLLGATLEGHNRLKVELDRVGKELKDLKHARAMEVLERYSHLRFKGDNGNGAIVPAVKVRYHDYGSDYELAQKIKGLFTQYVKWPVTLDASTEPALPRAERFKVVFDVGISIKYYELADAFSDCDLGVTVGVHQNLDREDTHNLIVLVLPSAPRA